MGNGLDLSVVVPTYARAGAVHRLLDALSQQTLGSSRFEVIIAIDGSRDGTVELIAEYESPYELSSIWQENSGRASACNKAIDRACAPIVLILDDDMEPTPECLKAHLEAHDGHRARCVLGAVPIELRPSDAPVARYFQIRFEAHLERLSKPDHRFVARDFYSGNLSVPRNLLFEAGLFDDNFTRYGNEDIDLALRLRAAGAEMVFEPRALAIQRFDKDVSQAVRDAEAKGYTALLVASKHPNAVPELRLGTYDRVSRPWRTLRRILLSASKRSHLVPEMLLRIALSYDRRGRELPPRYYDFLFDFYFWHGVEQEEGRRAHSLPRSAGARPPSRDR